MSDIDRSWMVRGTSFCKSVRLTWTAPAGVSGITGYKIRRTHNGHPVRETGRGNLPGGHAFVHYTEDFGRYGYDIATVGANTTRYVHSPLRPGAAGHKFTYHVAAITNNGDGFPRQSESASRRAAQMELNRQRHHRPRRTRLPHALVTTPPPTVPPSTTPGPSRAGRENIHEPRPPAVAAARACVCATARGSLASSATQGPPRGDRGPRRDVARHRRGAAR